MLKDNIRPVANPLAILREEFDDWAILFDPDLDTGFGLNSVSVFIWKRLDGRNTLQDIVSELHAICDNAPEEADELVKDFVQDLVDRGLAGYESQNEWTKTYSKGAEKSIHERIEWRAPEIMELGHHALNNIAAYAQGTNDVYPCRYGSAATDGCDKGGIPTTPCGCG